MAQTASGMEWRITVEDGLAKALVSEAEPVSRVWLGLKRLIQGLILKVRRFLAKAWNLGVEDPRKVIHCLKVGLALSVVSLFYYARPLYDGVGGNAMWAVMTAVVVFENTEGATIYKCVNRLFGTSLAAFLALGVHWVASQSGEKLEPFVIGVSVFLLAAAATFSRFIPKVKDRFDYGVLIFILTFSLVAVSGYRVDRILGMAHQRISTIIIGTSLCILVNMFICPIWAGQEVHTLITRNMDKLADSLDGCVAEYLNHNGECNDNGKQSKEKLLDYKCVLSSKTEESLIKFARWEPAHGPFNFKHPWEQYLKVGASIRSCAYCIEAINNCLGSEHQASEFVKRQLGECLRLSSKSSNVMRELAKTVKTMKKSTSTDFSIEEMRTSVQELRCAMKFPPNLFVAPNVAQPDESKEADATTQVPILEIIPGITLASLLIEVAGRIEATSNAVKELANLAGFEVIDHKSEQNQPSNRVLSGQSMNEENLKTLQKGLSS